MPLKEFYRMMAWEMERKWQREAENKRPEWFRDIPF